MPFLEGGNRRFVEHAGVTQRLQCDLHAMDGALQRGVGVKHEAKSHLGGGCSAHNWRLASEHDVQKLRRGEPPRHLLEVGELDEGDIGAGFEIATGPIDGCIETLNRAGVGPRDDDEVVTAGIGLASLIVHTRWRRRALGDQAPDGNVRSLG